VQGNKIGYMLPYLLESGNLKAGGHLLKSQSTADLIARSLRLDISIGVFRPGTALRQEMLAERFEVSRIPVREALRQLESDGLVEVFPNRGAFVVKLSPGELQEISDLRILIEGDLILRSVPVLTQSDLTVIRSTAAEAKRALDTPFWIEADRIFHQALYAPARRERQLALFLSLRIAVERYDAIYRRLPEQKRRWLKDHNEIIEACTEHNHEKAHRCLIEHIRSAGDFLVRCAETDEAS